MKPKHWLCLAICVLLLLTFVGCGASSTNETASETTKKKPSSTSSDATTEVSEDPNVPPSGNDLDTILNFLMNVTNGTVWSEATFRNEYASSRGETVTVSDTQFTLYRYTQDKYAEYRSSDKDEAASGSENAVRCYQVLTEEGVFELENFSRWIVDELGTDASLKAFSSQVVDFLEFKPLLTSYSALKKTYTMPKETTTTIFGETLHFRELSLSIGDGMYTITFDYEEADHSEAVHGVVVFSDFGTTAITLVDPAREALDAKLAKIQHEKEFERVRTLASDTCEKITSADNFSIDMTREGERYGTSIYRLSYADGVHKQVGYSDMESVEKDDPLYMNYLKDHGDDMICASKNYSYGDGNWTSYIYHGTSVFDPFFNTGVFSDIDSYDPEEDVYYASDDSDQVRLSFREETIILSYTTQEYYIGGYEEASYEYVFYAFGTTSFDVPAEAERAWEDAIFESEHPDYTDMQGVIYRPNSDGTSVVVGYEDYLPKRVTIPAVDPNGNTVVAIGDRAFYECKELTSITIPSKVTSIGKYAFSWCSALTSVTLPDSLISLGDDTFSWCDNLKSIRIPKNLTEFGESVFYSDSGIKITVDPENPSVYMQDGMFLTQNGEVLYLVCDVSGDTLTVPNGVKEIASYAINSAYKYVYLPEGLTKIRTYAFSGWGTYGILYLPASLTELEERALPNYLSDISLASGNRSFKTADGILYSMDGTRLIRAPLSVQDAPEILDTVCTVDQYAFYHLRIVEIVLPDGVISIGKYAFAYCSDLEYIYLPEGLQTIGWSAFYDCSSLTELYLPSTVTEADWYFISGCSNLEKLVVRNPDCYLDSVWGVNSNLTVYGYAGSTAEKWAEEYGFAFSRLRT